MRDTFLHVPPSLYRRLSGSFGGDGSGSDGGMLVSLWPASQNDSKHPLLAWMVLSILPSTNDFARSASLESGEYSLVGVPRERLPPALARIELSVSGLADYAAVQEHASALIEWLFLAQVRLVRLHHSIRVWLDEDSAAERAIDFRVESLVPRDRDTEYGMVGVDAELVIIPSAEGEEAKSKGNSVMKKVRVRSFKCSSSENANLIICTSDTLLPPDHDSSGRVALVKVRRTGGAGPTLPSYSLGFQLCPRRATDLYPEWLYVSDVLMKHYKWQHHQWISICDVHPDTSDGLSADWQDELLPLSLCRGAPPLEQFSTVEQLLADALLRVHPPRGLILVGEEQVGKSHLLRALHERGNVPMHLIDLATIAGEKELSVAISEGHLLAPCMFVFDHLEALVPDNDQDDGNQENDQLLLSFLDRVQFILDHLASPVLVVLGSPLAPAMECISRSPLFIKTFTLDRPRADHRRSLLLQGGEQELDIEAAVKETAGWLPRQICAFVPGQTMGVARSPVSPCLPLWTEIRGLDEARVAMEETILWPLLYGDFYEANGFAPPGGVLLVGPTGAGKTLLARAFLGHLPASVATFSVAGPALLGKYVGSSERAVRDLFARARAQRPALVVLEELDALAPRRGRDATGTTDRVVNQLLTELDGTGERAGVHVLATSSRMDLVDPAVLRSGRLETHIHLRLPDEERRRDILHWLTPGWDEEAIARLAAASEGLNVAQLKSILLQSQEGKDPIEHCAILKRSTRADGDPTSMALVRSQRTTFA